MISNDLEWDLHIANVASTVNRTLGFVRHNVHISSCKVKEAAYKALVRPLMEYPSPVWDPYTIICSDSIEKMSLCLDQNQGML